MISLISTLLSISVEVFIIIIDVYYLLRVNKKLIHICKSLSYRQNNKYRVIDNGLKE